MATDNQLQVPKSVRAELGGKGKKLRTHRMTLERLEKGKVLATHQLADKNGNPPTDGQRSQMQYALNPDELASHVEQHMGAEPGQEDEEGPEQE